MSAATTYLLLCHPPQDLVVPLVVVLGGLAVFMYWIWFDLTEKPEPPRTRWRCRRCGQEVDMRARRCGCAESPSPWEEVSDSSRNNRK